MNNVRGFDNYYYRETEQYDYFVLPKVLISSPVFAGLSDKAKILYSVLLSRSALSSKKGWVDDSGRVYIIYSTEEMAEDAGISVRYVVKLSEELANFGLIEKKRRGQGKSNIIYVKNFNKPMVDYNASDFNEMEEIDQDGHSSSLEVNNCALQEVNSSASLEMNNSALQEVNSSALPIKRYIQEKKNINISSSSINLLGVLDGDDDEVEIKNRIGFDYAVSVYGSDIAVSVYSNIKARGKVRLLSLSQSEFLNICKGIADYRMPITDLDSFVNKCVDNMLKAKELALDKKRKNHQNHIVSVQSY